MNDLSGLLGIIGGIITIISALFSFLFYLKKLSKRTRIKKYISKLLVENCTQHIRNKINLINGIFKIYKESLNLDQYCEKIDVFFKNTVFELETSLIMTIKTDKMLTAKFGYVKKEKTDEMHERPSRGDDDRNYYVNKFSKKLCWEEEYSNISLKDVFIEQDCIKYDYMNANPVNFDLCAFFSEMKFEKRKAHFLLGNAGSGKTSLASKYAYDYNYYNWFSDREVFFINAKRFNNSKMSLFEYLNKEADDLKGTILWIDGIDELSSIYLNQDNKNSFIINLKEYMEDNMIIMSMRQFESTNEIINNIKNDKKYIYSVIEIQPYNKKQQQEFVQLYLNIRGVSCTPNSFENFNFTLYPMTLYTYIVFRISSSKAIHNQYDLYDMIVKNLDEKKKYDNNIIHNISEELIESISISDINFTISKFMFLNGTSLLNKDLSKKCMDYIKNNYHLNYKSFNLLRKYLGLSLLYNCNDNINEIEYDHSSLMEFFISKLIMEYSIHDKTALIELLKARPLTQQVNKFIRDMVLLEADIHFSGFNMLKDIFQSYLESLDEKALNNLSETNRYLFINLNNIVFCKFSVNDVLQNDIMKKKYISLTNSCVTTSEISNLDLINLSIEKVNSRIIAKNTLFNSSEIKDSTFFNSNFYKANFSNVSLKKVKFYESCLNKATFNNANLFKCVFRESELVETDFSTAKIRLCVFMINISQKFNFWRYFLITVLILPIVLSKILYDYFIPINPELSNTLLYILSLGASILLTTPILSLYVVWEGYLVVPKQAVVKKHMKPKR